MRFVAAAAGWLGLCKTGWLGFCGQVLLVGLLALEKKREPVEVVLQVVRVHADVSRDEAAQPGTCTFWLYN